MRKKQLLLVVMGLAALTVPVSAATTENVNGNWSEVFVVHEGAPGCYISALLTEIDWTVNLPKAVSQGATGGPSIYVTDYVVDPLTPATVVSRDGCVSLTFSNLTLTVTASKLTTPNSFTLVGSGTDDSGMVTLTITGRGTVATKSGQLNGDTQSGPMWATFTITATPAGSTFAAENVTATSAKLYGDVLDTNGLCTQYRFVYWPDGGSALATPWTSGAGKPLVTGDVVGWPVTGLTPGTVYHYRLELRNAGGTGQGNVRDFVTTARLTISSEPHGSVVTPGEGVFLGTRGKSLSIEAQAGPGYVFGGWTGSAVDAGLVKNPAAAATTYKWDGDQTLVATFNAKVLWVSFHAVDANASAGAVTAGFVEAPDRAYTDLLASAGYAVERFVTTNTPDVNVLNAAALVIIGRSVNSGNFQNERATLWNTQVTVPVINTGGYTLRKNRMGFSTGNTIPDTTGNVRLTAMDPTHPIFAGISLTDGTMDANYAGICTYPDGVTLARGISVNTDPVDPNGVILATISAASAATGPAGAMMIAEWPAGVVLKHDGGGLADTLAAPRMVFLTGSREASGKNSEGTGMMDLTEDGKQMFLNAVQYMLWAHESVAVVNSSFEDPNTGKIKGWNGTADPNDPAAVINDIPGWASDGNAVDSGVEQGWGATDGTWTGFIMNGDPFVYQLTGYAIQAGDVVFSLTVDAKNNWAATKFLMTLYYDDGAGVRVPLATREVDLTDAMQTFSVWFSPAAAPDSIGKQLGIEFANSTPGAATAWLGLDQVGLSVYRLE